MRWVWRNGGMKFIVGENERSPEINLARLRFVHHETPMEWPKCELGTPAMEGERLSAWATEPPPDNLSKLLNIIFCYMILSSNIESRRVQFSTVNTWRFYCFNFSFEISTAPYNLECHGQFESCFYITYFWGPLHFSVVTLYSLFPSLLVIPVPFIQLPLMHHPRYSRFLLCSRPTPFPFARWRPLHQYIWPFLLIYPSYMTIPLELSILNSFIYWFFHIHYLSNIFIPSFL